jgi:peptide/nickel transport system substrate-binding protein
MRLWCGAAGVFAAGMVMAVWSGAALAQGKTVTVAVGTDITTTDPHKISGGNEYIFFTQVFEGLYGHDLKGQLEPHLASGYTVSSDGLTYTFKLRPNVKWHNGEPFVAEDVVYSWKRATDPEIKNPRLAILAGNIKEAKAIDPSTVELVLKTPDASMLENMGEYWYIVPSHAAKVGNEEFAKNPIGSGPYRFVERKVKESFTLEAFKDHWGRKPEVDRLQVRVVNDAQTRVAMLKTGEADIVVDIPLQNAKEVEKDPNVKLHVVPSLQNIFLTISNRKSDGTWKDVRVRQAVAHAIDRKTIIDKVMLGYAKQTTANCQVGVLGCDTGKPGYAYDPNKAKALLKAAGWDANKTIKLVGIAPGRTPQSKEVAEAIAFFLNQVGMKTQVEIMEYGAWLRFAYAREADKADMLFFTWTDYNNDPMGRLPRSMRTDGALSWNSYPELDALIDAANGFTDPQARLAHLRKTWTWINDNVPQVGLWTVDMLYGTRKNVEWTPAPGVSWPVLWKLAKK